MELELLAVLLALFVLATPVLAISALWRQRKLRLHIEELAHQTSQQNDALHRELIELRRQLTVLTHVPAPPAKSHEQASEPSAATPISKSQEVTSTKPISEAPPKPVPAPPHEVEPTGPPAKSEPILCPWCSTVHAGGVANCPPAKPPVPLVGPTHAEPVRPQASISVPAQAPAAAMGSRLQQR